MKKGYIYTLEALLAISLVFLGMTAVFKQPAVHEAGQEITKFHAAKALEYLADTGYMATQNKTLLRDSLQEILPGSIDFAVDICSTACTPDKPLPQKPVVAEDYYYADGGIKKVRIWVWMI